MGQFTAENTSFKKAAEALQENLALLDPEKHKAARNMTVALVHILNSIQTVKADVGMLHNKLQPILKYLEEENSDWRSRTPNYDGE